MLPIENFILFGMPGPLELVIILIIILLLVGQKKLPELMKAIGKSFSSFKKGLKEGDNEDEKPKDKD